jgi:hypothetical protein
VHTRVLAQTQQEQAQHALVNMPVMNEIGELHGNHSLLNESTDSVSGLGDSSALNVGSASNLRSPELVGSSSGIRSPLDMRLMAMLQEDQELQDTRIGSVENIGSASSAVGGHLDLDSWNV